MAGGIVGLRYALGGMCVGGCGPGLIYGGQRLPVRCQVAQVEGDSLGSCGHVLIAVGVGPGRESGPASAVGPAGVGGLGIPEACGDGLGCVMVTGREVERSRSSWSWAVVARKDLGSSSVSMVSGNLPN